jgi:hypothetical protein
MSKKQPQVYIIKSHFSKKIYVGSCNMYLSMRKSQHKYSFNCYRKGQKNDCHIPTCASRLIYEEDPNPEVICCETLETTNEMKDREQYWKDKLIEKGFDVVNIRNPKYCYERFKKKQRERYAANPDKQKKKMLDYYYENKTTILENASQKRKQIKQDLEKLRQLEALLTNKIEL